MVDEMLDEARLQEARAARDRYVDLQHLADQGQVAYQHAIRRLHASGGSLREIADALGVSYQRVHQILDPGTGKGALKQGAGPCSFCGRPEDDVESLIAGPRVFICDGCVERERAAPSPARRCAFCRRRGAARICGECLDLCDAILAEARQSPTA